MYVDHLPLIGYFSDKDELIKPEPRHNIPPVEVSDSGEKQMLIFKLNRQKKIHPSFRSTTPQTQRRALLKQ